MDWDLTSYFSDFHSPTYTAYKNELEEKISDLSERVESLLGSEMATVNDWEAMLIDYELMHSSLSHISSYIGCLVSAEAQNEAYLKEEAALADIQASIAKLADKIMRGIGAMEDTLFGEFIQRDRLDGAQFWLQETREQSQKRMPAEMEELAADLGVNGISSWSRLYFSTMGNMKFRYNDPETGEQLVPVSQRNSLLSNPNRERRKAVLDGANETFEQNQQTFTSALNAISGTRHTLNRKRNIDSFLHPSLKQSRIQQTTLEALMQAIENRIDFGRSVFSFRSKVLGIDDPGYADLHAPLTLEGGGPTWKEGVDLVSTAFNTVYPAMGVFFDEVINKQWVDYTPRDGKRPGGFCTGSLATRESRIFMTYKDTLSDVLTLAHEAGHAWHSRLLKDQRVFAARYPMTIAESASTFAERILTEGVLASDAYDDNTKLVLLDADVNHMLSFLLDLPVRFRFEEELYRLRANGTLSASEICNLMSSTQRRIFGDSLAPDGEDPWFWASKLHFYIEGVQFYNYPYTFGYLLSTAFMNRFRDSAEEALNAFERYLRNSGKMSCEDVVQDTLGEDISDPNFWANLIDGLDRTFQMYKDLLAR
ncbi:MAG: M3 family metallopeptidase [Puniceicoccaceae bacterium]